jgi:hypothetical protein
MHTVITNLQTTESRPLTQRIIAKLSSGKASLRSHRPVLISPPPFVPNQYRSSAGTRLAGGLSLPLWRNIDGSKPRRT